MGRPRKPAVGAPVRGASTDPQKDVDRDPEWVDRVRRKLAAWYIDGHRDLPWRADRDPYRILVSEMMLIQTTVAAAAPFFGRFLARFPTVESLAGADEAAVIKAWEGLGYYRRARQLHAAARAIVHDHGGTFPESFEAVRALPGVGRYIAGAILSFAFDQAVPILEANTQRVLARWLAWREDIKSSRSQARLWDAAGRLVPPAGAGTFNQAFMELGATVCTPRAPMCLVCPVSADCRARLEGIQEIVPTLPAKAPPLQVVEACALVVRGGRILIVRRAPGGLWDGFWEFPTVHVAGADPGGRSFEAPVDLEQGVLRLTGVRARIGPEVTTVRYGVTKHRVTLTARGGRGLSDDLKPGPGLVQAAWERPEDLRAHPFSAAGRRLVAWVLEHRSTVDDFESHD